MASQTVVMITPHGDPLGRIGEPDVGGQCVYIRELSSALAAQGTKVLAFTRDRSDGKPEREQMAPGADLIRIPCGPEGFLAKEKILPYLSAFANEMSTYLRGDEIISSHFWDGGYVAGLLKSTSKWIHTSHSLGKRKLASLPQADHAKYSDRIRTESEIVDRCDAVVASTTLERQDLVNLYGADEAKISVIPPGVDTNRFHPPHGRQAQKKDLGLSQGPVVFTMGRLDLRKGFDLFFRAAAQVIEMLGEQTDIQFVLSAGTDTEDLQEATQRDHLAKLLKTLRIEKSVRWLPVLSVEEVPLYYGASDIFVMPSRYELFGIVLLEAMACGIPVIATKFGGPPEIVSDGKDGRLVDPTDINLFASTIIDLVNNRNLRKQMGKTAREHVEERYCWKTLAREHQKLYANEGEE